VGIDEWFVGRESWRGLHLFMLEISKLNSAIFCRSSVCLMIIAALAGLAACNSEQPGSDAGVSDRPAADAVVARVGDEVITVAYLEHAIRSTPRPEQFEYVSPPLVRELVEILIDQKLMAAEARSIGLEKSEELSDVLAAAGDDAFKQERILAQAYLGFSLEAAGAVSDEAIGNYYDSNPEEFTAPERVRVTRVILPAGVAAAHVADLLRQGYTAEAITDQSDGSIQTAVLWLQRRGEPGPIEQQAFALPAGEVSDAIPVATGLALVRVDEHRAEQIRPLVDVRSGIAQRLAQRGQGEALDATRTRLRASVEISVEDEVLDAFVWED
jgi:hypothetical protein